MGRLLDWNIKSNETNIEEKKWMPLKSESYPDKLKY